MNSGHEKIDMAQVHCVFVYEFLREVMRHAIDTASKAFGAGRLPRLCKAFDLVFLAFRTCG